jgi:hypothetical protein
LYSSLNIIKVVELRRIGWVGGEGHVTLMGQKIHTGFWWGNLKEGDWFTDPYVDERIVLKWILNKKDWRV